MTLKVLRTFRLGNKRRRSGLLFWMKQELLLFCTRNRGHIYSHVSNQKKQGRYFSEYRWEKKTKHHVRLPRSVLVSNDFLDVFISENSSVLVVRGVLMD